MTCGTFTERVFSYTLQLGGTIAGWIMPNMKGKILWFKMPLKLPACNINLWVGSMTKKNTVSLYAHPFKSRLIVPTHGSIPPVPCRGQYLDENDSRILLPMETSPGNVPVKTTEVAHNHHIVGFGTAHSSNYEWHQANCCNLCCKRQRQSNTVVCLDLQHVLFTTKSHPSLL